MKKTRSYLSALMLLPLVSCGLKGGGKITSNDGLATGFGEIKEPQERNYTTSELAIGRRICGGLKNKRELFEKVVHMEEKFRFTGQQKLCDNAGPGNNYFFNVAISNAGSNLEYVATSGPSNVKILQDVVTDQNGVMAVLCDSLQQSDNVSNHLLDGSSSYAVSFLIKNGYDNYIVLKRSKNEAGDFALMSADDISIITQASQAPAKFFGVEKERTLYAKCKKPEATSYTKQIWTEALTSFEVKALF